MIRRLALLLAVLGALLALAPAGARADTDVPFVQGRVSWQFLPTDDGAQLTQMTLVTAEPGAITWIDCVCAPLAARQRQTIPATGLVSYDVPIDLPAGVLMQVVIQEAGQRQMAISVSSVGSELKTDYTCSQLNPEADVPCTIRCPDGVGAPSPADPCTTANTRTRIDHAGVSDNLSYGTDGTKFIKLTLSKMPKGSTLLVFCGRNNLVDNCPAFLTALLPRNGRVDVARHLGHRRLKPGTTLDLWLFKPDYISDVLRYTIRRDKLPKVQHLCVGPAQSVPARCP